MTSPTPAQGAEDVAGAERYARNIAVSLHAKHWAHVTNWKPLEGDLIGLLTQIDNMTAGLQKGAAVDAETVRRVLEAEFEITEGRGHAVWNGNHRDLYAAIARKSAALGDGNVV